MAIRLDVVAGILRDGDGRVLIAQRLPGTHMAGRWEFPGGKLRTGEAGRSGLVRELDEELAISVVDAVPWRRSVHRYPDREIHVEFWDVAEWRGTPHGREGQRLKWVSPRDLADEDLLEADAGIVHLLVR